MKRGQVTAFIIVGLVVLIVIILALFARDAGIGVAPKKYLQSSLLPIQDEVRRCSEDVAIRGLDILGSQGGDMNPVNYRLYNGNKIRYLCTNIPKDTRCMNALDPLSKMEKQLNDFMNFELQECLDVNKFKGFSKTYDLEAGMPKVSSKFLDENVLVSVDYPITLSKDGESIDLPVVKKKVDIPIAGLYLDVYNIVQSYATIGDFDSLPYMLRKRGSVEILTKKPHPDIIFILNAKDSDFVFQFAIEGEEEEIE